MYLRHDGLTGVLIYDMDPVYEYELPESEFKSWRIAHHRYGAAADSWVQKILMAMLPGESFAEASAKLGYGNVDKEETRKWYYDRGILIINGVEGYLACTRG